MDEPAVEGDMQDDEGMPTPRALEQVTDAEELPRGDRSSNDA